MKIRMSADKKFFDGTPTKIVQRMRETDHQTYDSLDAYIKECCLRLKVLGEEIHVSGDEEETLCLDFLGALVARDHARLVVDSPEHVDKFAVALLRRVLGLSQERLAHEIGVAHTTVNRWER